MVDRLNITDFNGGLHLRRSEFTLAHNQSPDMLNIDIDPKVGIITRHGWTRWNSSNIVTSPTSGNWNPRNAHIRQDSDGGYSVFIANGTTIYYSTESASFSNASVTVGASPHLADFAAWGDLSYVAAGWSNLSLKGTTTLATINAPAGGGSPTYNDDYTTPVGGRMPRANLVEAHLGYLFVAGLKEDTNGDASLEEYPNRIRWSHPNEPEDWATLDFIDIKTGGSKITALHSFGDVLLIFKEDSVWGLYGYNAESWQLVQISAAVGAPSPTAVTASPSAVYFYSGASRGGIFALPGGGGSPVHISDPLEEALNEISEHDNVWLAWLGRRLWCCLPWDYESTSGGDSVFVFDPEVGDGAWSCHKPALGALACVMPGSDIIADKPFGVVTGASGAAAVLDLDGQEAATDQILTGGTQSAFATRYRTGWKDLGTPDLQKGWLRPRFVVGATSANVQIDVKTYWNFDDSAPQRTQRISVVGEGVPLWDALGSGGAGFDWGDGTDWGANVSGSLLLRTVTGDSLGWASAVSLEFSTNSATPGVAWAVTGIILKYRQRRSTT